MNYELQRQTDAHKARLARFGVSEAPPIPVVRRSLPRVEIPPLKPVRSAPPVEIPKPRPLDDSDHWSYHGVKPPAPHVQVKRIIAAAADQFLVSVDDILGEFRNRDIVFARFVAIHRIHHAFPQWSYPRIGRAVGKRNHTSIMYALGKLERKPKILAEVLEAV